MWPRAASKRRDGCPDSPSRTRTERAVLSGGLEGRRHERPMYAAGVKWGARATKRRHAARSTGWAGGMFSLQCCSVSLHGAECNGSAKSNQGSRNKSSGIWLGAGWANFRTLVLFLQGLWTNRIECVLGPPTSRAVAASQGPRGPGGHAPLRPRRRGPPCPGSAPGDGGRGLAGRADAPSPTPPSVSTAATWRPAGLVQTFSRLISSRRFQRTWEKVAVFESFNGRLGKPGVFREFSRA